MESLNNRNIVTAPVSSDDTGDAGGGSSSPAPTGANQGRCEGEAPQPNAKWRSHNNQVEVDFEKMRREIMEEAEITGEHSLRKGWYQEFMDKIRKQETKMEVFMAAADALADVMLEGQDGNEFLPGNIAFVVKKALEDIKAEATNRQEEEDNEFRMPRKEASPNIVPQPKKRKISGSPLSQASFIVEEDVQLGDDDEAIGVGIQVALAQATSLTSEVEAANAKGEVRDHIAQSVSELCRTVTGISDFWAMRSPNTAVPLKAAPNALELREVELEVAKIEGVIAQRNGKGISKVIQDASKQLRTLLTKIGEKPIAQADPEGKPSSSREEGNPTQSKKPTQKPEGEKVIENKKKKVKKKKKKKQQGLPKHQGKRKLPLMPQGIVISAAKEGASYADIAKKLTAGVNLAAIGVSITSMKRSKEGRIVLTVGKGEEAAKLKAEAEKVLGTDAVIRESARPILMEVLGVGCYDSADDVISGICRDGAKREDVTVRRLVPSFGGAQRAIVQVTGSVASQLMKSGTVKIGFLSCRVRPREHRMERCFLCHDYGHKASGCKGPDRSKQCMTCGEEGHLAKDCRAPPHCVLCEARQRNADHYPGSGKCEAYRTAKAKMKK